MSDLGIDALQTEGHKPKHKHLRGCLAVLVAFLVIAGVGVFAYVKGVDLLKESLAGPEDYSGDGHGRVVVEVKDGDTASEIAHTLFVEDVVKSEEAFTDAALNDQRSLSIQVGYYQLHKKMSGKSALKLMLDPKAKVTNLLTIPEGLRVAEIRDEISKETTLSKRQVDKALARTKKLDLPRYADRDPEGYLFPSTYDLPPDIDAGGLLRQMTGQFDIEADKLGLERGARRLGRSPAEVVTVASLVQSEARRTQDMPKVARVIYNRLDQRIRLQMDSTLHYAVDSRGEVVAGRNLRAIDSPYNTYKHAGLPPTPIAAPGADALEAAIHPADGDWIYFVTVNLATGETKFADSYRKHLNNVREYNEYCRKSDEC